MKALAGVALLVLAGCSVLIPETAEALEKLPLDFWVSLGDLTYAIGSDIYSWVEFFVKVAL